MSIKSISDIDDQGQNLLVMKKRPQINFSPQNVSVINFCRITASKRKLGLGSELQNHFKYDLKSNQNQFLKYDFHPIKIIF